ncbi:GntR family transcriptional regulator [Peribacillus sp. SCS-37]|uniref:GntR family transcriptional regulator n=1 Tax=Paraperibacillus esterisolvens TaxID=3115296 RepID=UPI0039064B3A
MNTLQEEAVFQIKKLIIDGVIKLGQQVKEVELSSQLNMSRGPIREALRILNQEGLVTYFPRRGMFVTSLEKSDISEIYDIRMSLEKTAVDLGFHMLTEETVQYQTKLVQEMKVYSKENRKDKLVALDIQFHESIVKLPGYRRLLNTWASYNALIELIFAKVFELKVESGDDISQNHDILVHAIVREDKQAFIHELEDHYMSAKQNLLNIW